MNKIAMLCLLITACDVPESMQRELTEQELYSLPVQYQCETLLSLLCEHQALARANEPQEIPRLKQKCELQTNCSNKILGVPQEQVYQCYLCLLDTICWSYTIVEMKQMPLVCDHAFITVTL